VAKVLDPVTHYAREVMAGSVIAPKLVRLACQRHLRDLEEGPARGLVWRADEAQQVVDFFAAVLKLPDVVDGNAIGEGKPFILSPFQAFIAGSLFGWYGADGYRRFHHAYVETAKGSGKTPFGAGLLIYMAVCDGERGMQCFCAAVTREQATLAFTDAMNIVKASPDLSALFDQKVNNLAILETGSFIRPISAEKRGLDGKRVHGALIDELHEHPSSMVTSKITAGTKDRRNALVLEITNSGFNRETVCWEHHDMSRQILEGLITNDSWFAFICHLDACEKCQASGKYQPADDCADCDDWKVEGPHWLKANPNLGVSLQWQYLRNQVQKAIDLPSERNMVRRLNFCQWTQQDTVWIPTEKWADCKAPSLVITRFTGQPCYVGIDLSDKIDLSAVDVGFPRAARPMPDGMVSLDQALDVFAFFFMPKRSIVKRSQEDKVPYDRWAADGFIRPTHGDTVDHDAIVDFIVTEIGAHYSIQAIGIDGAGAAAVINRLQREFGDEKVIEIPQSFRQLSEPSKTLEAMIVSRNIAHPGNPCLDWNLANMAIEENTWREIRPVKIDQRKRIDGGVALIDLIKVMQLLPDAGGSIYDSRGLVGV
jgi:phage terminase large subunit-like protein